MAEQDLSRAIGRLEEKADSAVSDIGDLMKRTERTEERVIRVERAAHTSRIELGALSSASLVNGGTLDAYGKRLDALEEPIKAAKASATSRQVRMRARIKQIGGGLVVIFGVVEWVAKPIAGYLAEQWVRGFHPPGQ